MTLSLQKRISTLTIIHSLDQHTYKLFLSEFQAFFYDDLIDTSSNRLFFKRDQDTIYHDYAKYLSSKR